MEDYIYTLLVIGWIVFGIVKAANKKKNKLSENSENSYSSDRNDQKSYEKTSLVNEVLSNIFDNEILKEDEISHPYNSHVSDNAQKIEENTWEEVPKPALDTYTGSDHITSVFATQNKEIVMAENINEAIDSQSEEEEGELSSESFDLRQAIIHQVILERPY